MVWKNPSDGKYDLYINGDLAGYIVRVKYKNGTVSWSGIAMNKKTKRTSAGKNYPTLAAAKSGVEKEARALRK